MNWLSIFAGVVGLLRSLVGYLHDRQTIDAATAEAALKGLKDANDAIDKANKARELVRADLVRGADPMSDDGYKRND